MQRDLRALRPFHYNGTSYTTGQLFTAYEPHASYLIARGLAEEVSIAPGTPVTTPVQSAQVIEGETKELKTTRKRK